MFRKFCLLIRQFYTRPMLFAAAIACVNISHAQTGIYSCKDENGRVIHSDRPIPECARREVRVLRNDGVAKEVLPAPLTDEQRKQKEIEDERKRLASYVESERKMRDRALLLAYPDMNALETARRRQIAEIEQDIAAAQKRILLKHPDLSQATAEANALKGKSGYAAAAFKVRTTATAILAEDELIKNKQAEIVRTNEKFDNDAKRLKELLDGMSGRLAKSRH